jgi:hypothetical protein
MTAGQALCMGFAILGLFWFLAGISTRWHPLQLILGEDGVPSTSKFQFLCWTAVVLFAYVTIFFFKGHASGFSVLSNFPTNLLLAMGISATSAVGAKAIASNSASAAAASAPTLVSVAQSPTAPDGTSTQTVTVIPLTAPKLGGILLADDGSPDPSKIQLIMWTVIAIGVFLVRVGHTLAYDLRELPDIDRTLMVLMGLGHTAYLGQKIANAQAN